MPRKRRPFKRRRKMVKRSTTSATNGFNDSYRTKLRYRDFTTILVGLPLASRIYRANGAFDPNFAVGGSQPMYFDQLAAVYSRYRVHGCTCRVTTIGLGDGSQSPLAIVLNAEDDSTPPSSYEEATERTYSKTTFITKFPNNVNKISRTLSTKKKLGYKNIEQVELLSSAVTADPGEQWFYIITMAKLDPAAADAPLVLDVELTYDIEFFDRKDSARS